MALLIVVLLAVPALIFAVVIPLSSQGGSPGTLTVLAASSLTDAFIEIGKAFEAANPNVKVTFSFGSSSQLAAQINQGAPADVFASANTRQFLVVADAGNITGEGKTFARNRLVVVVPKANPGGIQNLEDLAKPGLKLVLAAPNVPVRDYTDEMLNKMATEPAYGDAYKKAVLANVVSAEDNVRLVVTKVALGEADAGIVYRSDVTPDTGAKVQMFDVPDAYNTLATYPMGVVKTAADKALAQRFVDFVLSGDGQAVLARWNFVPVQ